MAKNGYYLGLKPHEFYNMLPIDFFDYAEQQVKRLENDNEANNMRMANILCMLANINRDKKKKPTPYKPKDFMPKNKLEDKKPMDFNVMAKMLEGFTIAHGGEVIA